MSEVTNSYTRRIKINRLLHKIHLHFCGCGRISLYPWHIYGVIDEDCTVCSKCFEEGFV